MLGQPVGGQGPQVRGQGADPAEAAGVAGVRQQRVRAGPERAGGLAGREHDIDGAVALGGPGDDRAVAVRVAERVPVFGVHPARCGAAVRNAFDPARTGDLVHSGQIGAPHECGDLGCHGRAGAQDHVVAVLGQLVDRPAALDPDVRGDPVESGEELGRDEEFLLPQEVLFDVAPARFGHRRVEGADLAQVADVADEQRPTRREQLEGLAQHLQQVRPAREVLDDGVEHDRCRRTRTAGR